MNVNAPAFEGTPEQQALAAEVFHLMVMQGSFFAEDAPIRQTLDNLADFLARQHKQERSTVLQQIEAALQVNNQVFQREQQDDAVVYVTSRRGGHPQTAQDASHTFKERLYQPDNPLPVDDISVVVSTSRPALTTVEPVFISDYWRQQAEAVMATMVDRAKAPSVLRDRPAFDLEDTEFPLDTEAETPPIWQPFAGRVEELPEPVALDGEEAESVAFAPVGIGAEEPAPVSWDDTPAEIVAEPPVLDRFIPAFPPTAELEAEVAEEVEMEAPVAPPSKPEVVELPAKNTIISLPDGTLADLSQPGATVYARHKHALETALLDALERDPLRRIVRFGNTLYPEGALASLGKNDLRRIRDDIMEAGEPLSDTAIISDLYHNAQRQPDYEGFRFSLNYRLSREKDFEFVGVEGACLWSVKGLPTIGSKRIKASEMAQLTSYLVEGYDDSLSDQTAEAIQQASEVGRVLTFFEWAYGVLVFDASLAALLPKPMLPEQRSAVLRVESPQHYTSYLVEVRYPTSNRGGWLQGLEDFFLEHLVAGAMITLARTEEPNVFTLVYEEMSGDSERILTLDEKKNKFAFADVNYFCGVDNDMFLSQRRFGRLKNLKSLPMNERRKSDMVLRHVFEEVGDQIGTRNEPVYQADIDTLYTAYSVLRPASRPFLQALLAADDAFASDASVPDIYTYTPEPEPVSEAEEEDTIMQWGYDDDE